MLSNPAQVHSVLKVLMCITVLFECQHSTFVTRCVPKMFCDEKTAILYNLVHINYIERTKSDSKILFCFQFPGLLQSIMVPFYYNVLQLENQNLSLADNMENCIWKIPHTSYKTANQCYEQMQLNCVIQERKFFFWIASHSDFPTAVKRNNIVYLGLCQQKLASKGMWRWIKVSFSDEVLAT